MTIKIILTVDQNYSYTVDQYSFLNLFMCTSLQYVEGFLYLTEGHVMNPPNLPLHKILNETKVIRAQIFVAFSFK